MKTILFDWSGTLVDDLPPVLEATNAVFAHCGKAALTREEFRRRFSLPFTRFYEREIPGRGMEELEPVFRQAFADSRAPVSILPFAREFVELMHARSRKLIVLSSASQEAVEEQARLLGLEHFFHRIHAGVRDKTEAIHDLLDHHECERASTMFIGDMVHDIQTARHGGVFSVAVLTGYDYPEVLAEAAPDLTVENLKQLADEHFGNLSFA